MDDGLPRRIRWWIAVFVVGLVISGLTAFPLGIEARALDVLLHGPVWPMAHRLPWFTSWIDVMAYGATRTYAEYPFMAYGTDWLAFAHLTIAVAFWGPYRDPVRNVWVLRFGLIACAGVVPLALICAPLRGLPLWWMPIDISFGVFGAIPLVIALRLTLRLERAQTAGLDADRAAVSGPAAG